MHEDPPGNQDIAEPADVQETDSDSGNGAPRTVHDAFFKNLMGDPQHAASVLRAVTPKRIADAIDWASLESEQASLLRDGYSQTHSDLLFKARWKADDRKAGRELYLRMLYEHQSTPDRWMPLRFFNMIHAVWKRHRERHGDRRRLPAVLCYVLYHGAKPWSAPTSLLDLIDIPPTLREELRPYMPSLEFILDDLRSAEDETLATRDVAPCPKIALFLFKHGPSRDLPEHLAVIAPAIAALLAAPGGAMLWESLLDYLWNINPMADEGRLGVALRQLVGPEVEETVISYAQKLRNEGLDKGRKQGLEQGRKQGRKQGRTRGLVEGQRAMLLRQLEARFTAVPAEVEVRVADATVEELQRWALRVLDAGSLDEVMCDTEDS